jgi:ABC-type Zn uptake system ZnuABC Zn-binding protein ZnuA
MAITSEFHKWNPGTGESWVRISKDNPDEYIFLTVEEAKEFAEEIALRTVEHTPQLAAVVEQRIKDYDAALSAGIQSDLDKG